ncbi:MAG: hypothetical protein H0U16_03660 [Actinobacteria bacterium]|nr:hypothetical protein [Actinomycetota bacterium]
MARALKYSGDQLGVPAPLRFSQSAQAAWRLYRGHFGALVAIYGTVFVAVGLLRTLGYTLFDAAGFSATATLAVVSLALTVLVAIGGSLCVAATSVIAADGVTGRGVTPGDAVRELRPKWRDLASAGLVTSMLSVLAIFLPFGVFGSIVVMPMLFGPPVLIHVIGLEGRNFGEAWNHAKTLLSGQMGRLLIYLLNVALGLGLLQLVLLSVTFPVASLLTGGLGLIAQSLVQALIAAVTLPLLGTMSFVCYLDVRARKEEFSLDDLRAERAAAHS